MKKLSSNEKRKAREAARKAAELERQHNEQIGRAAARAREEGHAAGVAVGDRSGYLRGVRETEARTNKLSESKIRTFKLVRSQDESGISGVGVVAEGVEFSNGTCAISWLTAMHSAAMYPNAKQLEAIHGHDGKTRLVFDKP